MDVLSSLFEYNRWCNARILEACAAAPEELIRRPMDGLFESVLRTAQHLAQVEAVYLGFVGGSAGTSTSPRDWVAMGIEEVRTAVEEIDRAYLTFVTNLDAEVLERKFFVPWFEREFAVGDGLLQVVTHSCEHRADLASALNRLGVETPPIDYVARLLG